MFIFNILVCSPFSLDSLRVTGARPNIGAVFLLERGYRRGKNASPFGPNKY